MSGENGRGEEKLMEVFAALELSPPTFSHETMHTVGETDTILDRFGVPCVNTKSMFLKSKKGQLVLLTALPDTRTDMKDIQRAAGVKDLRFASPEVMWEAIGAVQGSVTPLCLVNNMERRDVRLLLDRRLAEVGVPFALTPCRNDKINLLTFAQLDAVLKHIGFDYTLVDFSSASSSSPAGVTTGDATTSAAAAAASASAA